MKNKKRNELRAIRKSLKLCIDCGKPAEIGRVRCLSCLDKRNIINTNASKKFRAEGKCGCGKEKQHYKYRCDVCLEIDRLRSIRVRKKRNENNQCTRCGKPLIERTEVTKCINCMEGSIEFAW